MGEGVSGKYGDGSHCSVCEADGRPPRGCLDRLAGSDPLLFPIAVLIATSPYIATIYAEALLGTAERFLQRVSSSARRRVSDIYGSAATKYRNVADAAYRARERGKECVAEHAGKARRYAGNVLHFLEKYL